MRRRWTTPMCVIALMIAVPGVAQANDSYQDASDVPIGTAWVVDTTGATNQSDEYLECGKERADRTWWYQVTGTGGPIRLSTAYSDFDTVLSVYERRDGAAGPWDLANRPQIACSDNAASDGSNTAQSYVSFQSKAGQAYLVQAGGCADPCRGQTNDPKKTGNLWFDSLGNDDRAWAEPLTAGASVRRSNGLATTSPGETLSCQGIAEDHTVWYAFDAPATGTAAFSVRTPGTVAAVYRGDDAAPLSCGFTPDNANGTRVELPVTPGRYYMQVGMRAGTSPTTDLLPGVEFFSNGDNDGDGAVGQMDCNDADASIHPGARDKPRNGIDEDCSGRDANYKRVSGRIVARYLAYSGYTRFSRLAVRKVAKGTRIEVRCSGRGCFKGHRRVVKVRKAHKRVDVLKRLGRHRRLRPGTILEVRVLRRGRIGVGRRFTIRAHRTPRDLDVCVQPGEKKAQTC